MTMKLLPSCGILNCIYSFKNAELSLIISLVTFVYCDFAINTFQTLSHQ